MSSGLAEVKTTADERTEASSRPMRDSHTDPLPPCEALLQRSYPQILRLARTMCGNETDAEDIAQIVCMKIWRAMDDFRGEAKTSTWIYRITRNVAVQLYRRSRSIRRAEEEFLRREIPPRVENPYRLENLVVRRLLDAVPEVMEGLSDPQRQVVQMVDIRGFRPNEVARSFAMNPNTVRSHLLRGRRSLRSALRDAQPALVRDFKGRSA